MDQPREINAWIRNREVTSSQSQDVPVPDVLSPCNPLSFQSFKDFLEFSRNI
jgi:hypothetical protein